MLLLPLAQRPAFLSLAACRGVIEAMVLMRRGGREIEKQKERKRGLCDELFHSCGKGWRKGEKEGKRDRKREGERGREREREV